MKFFKQYYRAIGFSFIVLIINLFSCVTYKVSRYQNNDPIDNKIPNLALKGVEYNMETFYAPKVIRICKNDSLHVPRFSYQTKAWNREVIKEESGLRIRGKNYEDTALLQSLYYELYLGQKKEFQDKIISKGQYLPLDEIIKNSLNPKQRSYYEVFDKGCPEYAPYGTTSFIYNNLKGYVNNTLPDFISDICDIYRYEFTNNVCKNSDFKGYAVIKLVSDEKKNTGLSLMFVSVLTLYSISLVGFPLIVQTDNIEIGVDIYTLNDRLVASYTSQRKASASCAMYWGYSMRGARMSQAGYALPRATNSKAFHRALINIKEQISLDSKKISSELLKGY